MPNTDQTPNHDGWRFKFPNPADFNFNYWKLLNDDGAGPVATAPTNKYRIAIIGAGVAGCTAARELLRAGYKNIDIYEAEKGIGGRTWSEPSPLPDGVTTYELGAMRLPFFWPYDANGESTGNHSNGKLIHGPGSRNCVLDYYCTEFGISTQPFPNPGSEGVTTGIYIKRGRGPEPLYKDEPNDLPKPKLISWKNPGGNPGDDGVLDQIYGKWSDFKTGFRKVCQATYSDAENWANLWKKIIDAYQGISFRRFVQMAALKPVLDIHGERKKEQFASGLGMNEKEARILAVIGLGDGGWGAFYEISCLWVLRTMLFGFGDKLQLIQGKLNEDGTPFKWRGPSPKDSLGQRLQRPNFLGIQSLVECLFYGLPGKDENSLHHAMRPAGQQGGVHLFTKNPVRSVTFAGKQGGPGLHINSDRTKRSYHEVIITAPPWALGLDTAFDSFDPKILPWDVRDATDLSHFITSCKVFFPLKERYWESNPKIPQVIITDTFAQGVYGIAVRDNPGVLLASYTWEDDATKLIADKDKELADRCLEHLDNILRRCGIKDQISDYVNKKAKPRIVHWSRSRWHRGCARLYRPGNWELDRALLVYNRDCSAKSHTYLAGEAYSVEGGWIEPALRSALDAVIHLVRNTRGSFCKGFDFDRDYPKYENIDSILPRASDLR